MSLQFKIVAGGDYMQRHKQLFNKLIMLHGIFWQGNLADACAIFGIYT
jgi:hypothetical protein